MINPNEPIPQSLQDEWDRLQHLITLRRINKAREEAEQQPKELS